jgi:thiosulfate dehydrogenase
MNTNSQSEPEFVRRLHRVLLMVLVSLILFGATCGLFMVENFREPSEEKHSTVLVQSAASAPEVWHAPDSTLIPMTPEGDLIRYGRDLIAHTSRYLGPRGKMKRISNGMNCQNCHLKAGTKPFGNNYAGVASTYPRFRARSGSIESMEKRVNDCIERSLNGKKLHEESVEMRAIISYFKWLGKDVKRGVVPNGTGLTTLAFLERAADPAKGKLVYSKHCQVCHGQEGIGFKDPDSLEWKYPPLAGKHSYNTGAGLYRLSRLAGYVKSNMPNGTTYDSPVLSDEESWDVAAYVNTLPRPSGTFPGDWPDIASKPFDHAFGPYADNFSETQHKYGPFLEMKREIKK